MNLQRKLSLFITSRHDEPEESAHGFGELKAVPSQP